MEGYNKLSKDYMFKDAIQEAGEMTLKALEVQASEVDDTDYDDVLFTLTTPVLIAVASLKHTLNKISNFNVITAQELAIMMGEFLDTDHEVTFEPEVKG